MFQKFFKPSITPAKNIFRYKFQTMKKRFYQLGKQVLSLSAIIAGTLLFSNNEVSAQGVSINATGTGTAPDGSAILDLSVTNKGFLVPRMTQAQRNAITSPANSLLIYQTDNTPGFYYNSGTPGLPVWVTFGGGSGPTPGNDIDVTGTQVDIEPILDFVHTINGAGGNPLTITAPASNDLVFGSGGVERARFLSTGNFGVGDNTPAALLTVGSGDKFRVDANGNLIRVNDLAYSWPTAHVANSVLVNDGSGNLIWTTDHVLGTDLPSGYIWVGDASNNADEVLMSGDVAISNTGVTTIQDNSVDGTDISITGESATNTALQYNSGTGNWVAVNPASTYVTSFSAINTGLTPNVATTGAVTLAGTLDVDNGGTGATTLTGILKGNGTSPVTGITGTQWGATYWSDANTIAATAAGSAGNLLMSNGAGAPTWSNNIPSNDADYIWNQISSAQTAPSNFWISNIGKIDGSLQLKGAGANYTTITSAATGNYTLTLPVDDGTPNQILATDGSGGLSWATSFTNPMDQIGDIIYGSTAGAPSTPNDLDPGTAGMFLQTTGGVPAWSKVNLIDPLEVEGATEGELLIGASTGAAANLSAANMNTIRYSTGGAGSWLAATNLLNDGTDIGIATDPSAATSTTKLDIAGNVNATTGYYYTSGGVNNSDKSPMNVEVLENLPNTLNDYVEIGSFTTGAGAHNLRVSLTSDESQFSIAKTYVIVTNNDATGGAWQVVRPISDSGPFGSPDDNNFELLIRSNGAGVITLRIRNNNVGTAHTGTISVRIESLGKTDEEVFATSAASGNDATAYSTYSGSLSSNYIFNQTSQQASANFNISGSGSFGDGAAATPSITFGSDANTGIYRAGADILAFSTGGSARMQISAAGDVGVGTAPSGTYKFEVSGKVKSTGINETSDARLKMNFAAIDGALSKVLSMNGKYYDWRTSEFPQMNFTTGRQIGVIAQEIEKILPEVVTTGEDGYKAVEYSHIVPVLIEAIKEQQKIIDGQNSTITDLKASLENVLNRVNIIEKNVDLNTSKVNK